MKIDWLANPIRVDSLDEFKGFLKLGYEVCGKSFRWENNISEVKLALNRDGEQIIVEANEIFEYAASLVELYDFEKKKPAYISVPNTQIFWEFELRLSTMISREFEKPIKVNEIVKSNSKLILDKFQSWVLNEKYKFYPLTRFSELFTIICVVYENVDSLNVKFFSKEVFNLEVLSTIYERSTTSENAIALSFFLLSKKLDKQEENNDVLIGVILYDLKNKQVLAFNIISLTYFLQKFGIIRDLGFWDVASNLFQKSITFDGNKVLFKSYPPLSFGTQYQTILPWFTYITLSNPGLDSTLEDNISISIAEFFTFGFPQFPTLSGSFDYDSFSSTSEGRATIIMNFYHSNRYLKSVLRFDQSRSQPLVHIDFAFYEPNERKLISHRPLDMLKVSNFSLDLFISMMAAGLFDGNFNTLLKNNFQGINELQKKNPSYLYTFNIIYKIDQWLRWLNVNPLGYSIIKKLYYERELGQAEQIFLKNMNKETKIGDYGMFIENEDGTVKGINNFGFMILVRYENNLNHILIT